MGLTPERRSARDISRQFLPRKRPAYDTWVDQFNTLGLGENIPIANGTGPDSLIALDPKTREMITMRVPYPLAE